MTPPPPETETPPEPKGATLDAETAPVKPRRKRRTKAEMEAARAAKQAAAAEKSRIEPQAWMVFGLLLVFVGVCVYFDPVGFENSGSGQNQPWIQTLFVLLIAFVGKNPIAISLGALGLLVMGLGVRQWFRERAARR